jgi:Sugar diacid utilization regulator
MYHLSKRQAQAIVDRMMEDIPYNINIMNEQGIIIGSGNKKRIGSIHQGAVTAIKTKTIVEIYEDRQYEKKGTNEPIIIGNSIIGVIGISGIPDEVRPFCNIVKSTVVLLIEQEITLKKIESENQRQKKIINTLLYLKDDYDDNIKKDALEFKLDLSLKTCVLYIKGSISEKTSLLLQYIYFPIEKNYSVLLIQEGGSVSSIIQLLLHDNPTLYIGEGDFEFNISVSYFQAKDTVNALAKLRLPQKVASYKEMKFLVDFSQTPLSTNNSISNALSNNLDLLETLCYFIINSCSMSKTSLQLNIHRNTLQYRLRRIAVITNKDPNNFFDLMELAHQLLNV